MFVLALVIFVLFPARLIAPPEFMFSTFDPSPLIFSSAVPNITFLLPDNVILSLNIAAPPSDISKVKAVIADPLSSPLNIISLSCTAEVITASLELSDIVR